MATGDGKYVSLLDVRNEGVTTIDASDAIIIAAISQAERLIAMWTGRWFYKRTSYTITIDGGTKYSIPAGIVENSDTLFLTIPIIDITSITIDGNLKLNSDFILMKRIGPPVDDRWNPRIISKNNEWPLQGIQNIVLVGDFGFVEDAATGTSPELIKIAAKKEVIRLLPLGSMLSGDRELFQHSGRIVSEDLPGYKYQITQRGISKSEHAVYSGDPEIDSIVDQYKYKRFFATVDV